MTRVKGARELGLRLEAIGDTQKQMTNLANRTVFHAKRAARKFSKTRATSDSIKRGRVTDTSAEVSAKFGAVYLEHGTRAHDIYARKRKALRFVGRQGRASGQARLSGTARRSATDVVFVSTKYKPVRHPGTKAQPFMRPSAERAVDEMGGFIVEEWNGAA